MFTFLHTYHPQSILLKLGPIDIHWYGFVIVLGAVVGLLAILYFAKRYQIKSEQVFDLAFYLVLFGLIGDRLYYVIYAWEFYKDNLWDIFKIWEGGLAIFGAIIAGIITLIIYAKIKKLNILLWLDLLVLALASGLAFGRWGNYFNQELFGLPTNLPWGIPIDYVLRPSEFLNSEFFHPTFLYESLAMILVFILLISLHLIRLKTQKIKKGRIALAFFTLYFAERFLNEYLRLDFSPFFLGMRINQLVAGLALIACLIIWLYLIYLFCKNYISGKDKQLLKTN